MPAVLKLTGTLLSQNFKGQFISAHPCETKSFPASEVCQTQKCER